MTIQLVQVDVTGKDISDSTTSFTIDDIESINIKKDSEAKASYAVINLKNSYDRFITGYNQPFTKYNSNVNEIIFREGDTVKVYAAQIDSFRVLDTTSSNSADLILTGEIAEVTVKGENKSCKISLKVVDKTWVILNRLYTQVFISSDNVNSPEIIQKIARFVTQEVESDPLSYDDNGNLVSNGKYGVDARLVSEGGFIEDTRQDGSVFPDFGMAKVAKPAYDWINDLSSIESTNDFSGGDSETSPTQDRNMLFYIDELNRFHWFYPLGVKTNTLNGSITAGDTTITLTDGSEFPDLGTVFIGTERVDYTGKSGNNLTGCTRGANNTTAQAHSSGDTVRNAISITEGDTTSGYTLLNYNLTKKTFDIVNFVIFNCGQDMEGNGITDYFFDNATRSKTLKDTFKSYNDIAYELLQKEITAGRLTEDNQSTSPFTFKGNRYKETTGDYNGGSGIVTSWGVTVTTDNEYNTAFRAQCIYQGTIRAQSLTSQRGSPRWKGTMEFKFSRFTAGTLFEFTSTRAGINKQGLRIKTVQYNFTKSGAFCTLTVEEDEDSIGGAE